MEMILTNTWQGTLIVSGLLGFIYWDHYRSKAELKKIVEIFWSVQALLGAVILLIDVVLERSCYSRAADIGTTLIGTLWCMRHMIGVIKKIIRLPSQPNHL